MSRSRSREISLHHDLKALQQRLVPFDARLVPPQLASIPNWVVWLAQHRRSAAGINKRPHDPKVPYSARTSNAKADDPSTWGTLDQACAACAEDGQYFGPGYEMGLEPNGLVAIDVDVEASYSGPRDEDGIAEPASAIVHAAASYTERSPSGRGYRIFVRARLLPGYMAMSTIAPGITIEVYDQRKFLTVTTDLLCSAETGLPLYPEITDGQAAVEDILKYFMRRTAPTRPPEPPARGYALPVADRSLQELLELACRSDHSFAALYLHGTHLSLTNPSRLDMALCCKLAFWLPEAAIDGAFRGSALMREKWDRQDASYGTYGNRTIQRALERQTERYTGRVDRQAESDTVRAAYKLGRLLLIDAVRRVRATPRALHAFRTLMDTLLDLIGDGQFTFQDDGQIRLNAGGLDGLSVLVGGDRTTIRERLEFLAEVGVVGAVHPGERHGDPVKILMPLSPGDLPAIHAGGTRSPVTAPPTTAARRNAERRAQQTETGTPDVRKPSSARPATQAKPPTLHRARYIAETVFHRQSMTVAELAGHLGEGMHTTRRCVSVLVDQGYFVRQPGFLIKPASDDAEPRFSEALREEHDRLRRHAAQQTCRRRVKYYAQRLKHDPQSVRWQHRLRRAEEALKRLQDGAGMRAVLAA